MGEQRQRFRGTVKWFNETKGYGFIKRDDGGEDVFLHINHLPDSIDNPGPGMALTFVIEDKKKGPAALDVAVAV